MRIQEEYVAPALGVVILLALLGLDASPVVMVILGILGVAAVGTYLLPHEVQVELRVAIAAIGLLVLVFFLGSLALWLVLLAFGAMGALQVRHSDALQLPPRHTVEWFKAVLDRSGEARTAAAATAAGEEAGGEGGEEGEGAGETAQAAVAPGLATVQGGLSAAAGTIGTSPARLTASVLSALVVLCIFTLPFVWVIVTIEFAGQSESESMSYTFRDAARQLEEEAGSGAAGNALFVVLAAVAVVGIASAVLPRALVIIMGIAGMAVTFIDYIYLFIEFYGFSESAPGVSPSVVSLPHVGALFAGGCFLLITVLQLIPGLSRSRA